MKNNTDEEIIMPTIFPDSATITKDRIKSTLLLQSTHCIHNYGNGNRVIFLYNKRDLSKTKIKFEKSSCNNTLVLGENVTINGSEIRFKGSNSNIYINESKRNYKLIIHICSDSLFYIGKNCYFNDFNNSKAIFFVYEHQNIIIGDECLFSYNVTLRNSDSHLIYDVESSLRLNKSKSIVVGDHVWIGPNVFILKGTIIGSGSIIGANSVVSGKTIKSNTVWAGNPARQLRTNVLWRSKNSNNFTNFESLKFVRFDNKKGFGIFKYDEEKTLLSSMDCITIDELLKKNKNRFAL